jgi:hypothetical protein
MGKLFTSILNSRLKQPHVTGGNPHNGLRRAQRCGGVNLLVLYTLTTHVSLTFKLILIKFNAEVLCRSIGNI